MSASHVLLDTAPLAAAAGSLDRLEEVIDLESAALRAHRAIDLDDVVRRKSCTLLELTRVARVLPADSGAALKARVARLRAKLDENHALLRTHLAAMREIADLLSGALREAESDGTYTMQVRPWGGAR